MQTPRDSMPKLSPASTSGGRLLRLMGAVALAVAAMALAASDLSSRGFVDPLDQPAVAVSAADRKPMMAAARAGGRLVAVGMRGVILLSDNGGQNWTQVASPVQSDLTAVTFSSDRRGWIVGHDGVILVTADGGSTWLRQLDGRMAAKQFVEHYRAQVSAGHLELQAPLKEIERNYQRGPALPFLDVAFADDERGFAVGPFGLIAATQDGGRSWVPSLERVENPGLLSLYAARKIGADIYLAGERGMVYRLNGKRGVFERIPTGYAGSLFGIVGNEHVLVAYGLRGVVAISADGGARWKVGSLPVPVGLVGADVLDDGRVILVSATGTLWLGAIDGADFKPLSAEYAAPATAVLSVAADKVIVGGLRGVVAQEVPTVGRP
jgi:photosystem II stability/assembly factor-like uncharacterized protein